MEKNIKNAFSLFELLIVLAIISVLTVMLMTISKQGIENAYNRYYYASYKAMADAISYSNDRIYNDMPNASNETINKTLNYYYIGYAFGFKNDADGNSINQKMTTGKITYPKTANGVQYTIESNGTNYNITASLPSSNGEFDATFIYVPDANYGILIPYQASPKNKAKINLYERKDLLPFYIDNGINGRSYKYIKKDNGNYTIDNNRSRLYDNSRKNNDTTRHYDSFINTYCSLAIHEIEFDSQEQPFVGTTKDDYAEQSKTKVLNALGTSCSNSISATVKGFIKVANPQKVL